MAEGRNPLGRGRRDKDQGNAPLSERMQYVSAYARLLALVKANPGFSIASAIIVLLLIILIGANVAGSGSEDAGEAADATASQADAPAAETPSAAELEAQDPTDITEGTWAFVREGESYVLYSMDFQPDGTCIVPGEDTTQDGTYVVDGDSVEITLTRTSTFEGQNAKGATVSADGTWKEWFHMTRTGNTMRGSWEGEDWQFSPDAGFIKSGKIVAKNATVFAYPE